MLCVPCTDVPNSSGTASSPLKRAADEAPEHVLQDVPHRKRLRKIASPMFSPVRGPPTKPQTASQLLGPPPISSVAGASPAVCSARSKQNQADAAPQHAASHAAGLTAAGISKHQASCVSPDASEAAASKDKRGNVTHSKKAAAAKAQHRSAAGSVSSKDLKAVEAPAKAKSLGGVPARVANLSKAGSGLTFESGTEQSMLNKRLTVSADPPGQGADAEKAVQPVMRTASGKRKIGGVSSVFLPVVQPQAAAEQQKGDVVHKQKHVAATLSRSLDAAAPEVCHSAYS